MFEAANKNHHNDMIGIADIIPLVKKILRVCVISYLMFAKIKRADDLRPWAIIIASAPHIPQDVFVRRPASISPMWPTDE